MCAGEARGRVRLGYHGRVMSRPKGDAEKVLATNRKALLHLPGARPRRRPAFAPRVGTEVEVDPRRPASNFRDSYGRASSAGGELFLVGCRIAPYSHGNLIEPRRADRDRKLLLHRKEIQRLGARVDRSAA